MRFEWDEAKSAKIEKERGVSFQTLKEIIAAGKILDAVDHPARSDQRLLVIPVAGEAWVVVIEPRGERIRLVTAYPSRKWRKTWHARKSS
ncbi:MAG TPA: BrnT family toxin [Candidatus Methylacidiphilales bacterium]